MEFRINKEKKDFTTGLLFTLLLHSKFEGLDLIQRGKSLGVTLGVIFTSNRIGISKSRISDRILKSCQDSVKEVLSFTSTPLKDKGVYLSNYRHKDLLRFYQVQL